MVPGRQRLLLIMPARVLLISGSLRAASTNTSALRTVAHDAPDGIDAVLYERLAELPAFNPDDDGDHDALPTAVVELRDEVHRADAVLFCVPEYAGALPGSLKNLLDWTIGDAEPRSIYEKPVAWVNVSPRGAAGAHGELRTVLGYAHAHIVDAACVHVPIERSALGEDGLVAGLAEREALSRAICDLLEYATSR
jgi:chromate reductase, NAD(P)H dehydrogenase (quinone)